MPGEKKLKKAYFEITNICNLNCVFCPGTRRIPGWITPGNFQILAEKLRPHTKYLYLHLMGEPLLHPDLKKILSIAHGLKFQIMITTNGTLLAQRGDTLLENPGVKKVSISLHCFEGNGKKNGLEEYLNSCLSFARLAGEAGKRCALRLWNQDGADLQGANIQNPWILEQIAVVFPKPWKEGQRGTTLAPGVYLELGEKFEWPDLSVQEGREPEFCYGLRDQVGVLWDGTVVPCCLDHEGDIPLGNLYEQPLQEILNSPRARLIYEGFSRGQAVEPLCRKCGYARRFRR